jgi:DNA-binding IclR family transcriptional regulator
MTLLSVDRTLEVIDILTDRGEVGVSELAALLCVAPSTVHRILATLERRRFVVQDEDSKRYLPGPRMSGLSHEIDLIARSRPLVQKLGKTTEMTVHIGILDGGEARYLHHWAPGSKKAIGSRVGTQMKAHVTSAGKALLSSCPREQLLRIFPYSILETVTPSSIGDRLRLFEELQKTARSGYARNIEESEPGVVGLATAITHETAPIAIAVSAWRRDLPLERERVSETERRISHALMLVASNLEAHLRAS